LKRVKRFLIKDKYILGYGVPRNYSKAFNIYQNAASSGNSKALNMLGFMNEFGLGRQSDYEQAIELYMEAGEKGCSDGFNNIGRIYENGNEAIDIDHKSAYSYYMKAANLGNVDAMTNLGILYEKGLGVSKNIEKAINWLKKAIDLEENARAMNALGSIFYYGSDDIDIDYSEALKLFRKASEQGNVDATNNLGVCYEEGNGVAKNLERAKHFYKKASDRNHSCGTNNYGYIFLLEKKFDDAFKMFQIAKALGSIESSYNIGYMYETGVLNNSNNTHDMENAYMYYLEASEKNHKKSQLKIAQFMMEGVGCEVDEIGAKEILKSLVNDHTNSPKDASIKKQAQNLLSKMDM
jgi:TPR repeat protein